MTTAPTDTALPPTAALIDLMVDSTEGVHTLKDLRRYALFASLVAQMTGRSLGVAVRTALLDGAGGDEETPVEVLLDRETQTKLRELPPELTMLLSSTLGQLREVSVQLLAVEAIVGRYAKDQAS